MRSRTGSLAGAVVVAALVAGCGGGGGGGHYSASATQSCLEGQGLNVSREDADYIALDAAEGGYFVTVGGTGVDVSFERSADDARRTQAGYRLFAGALDAPVKDVLFRKGNVVLAWEDRPTDQERQSVEDCLA